MILRRDRRPPDRSNRFHQPRAQRVKAKAKRFYLVLRLLLRLRKRPKPSPSLMTTTRRMKMTSFNKCLRPLFAQSASSVPILSSPLLLERNYETLPSHPHSLPRCPRTISSHQSIVLVLDPTQQIPFGNPAIAFPLRVPAISKKKKKVQRRTLIPCWVVVRVLGKA